MVCGTFPEIARWWRKRQGTRGLDLNERRGPTTTTAAVGGEGTLVGYAKSTNPRTLLLSVTRSEDGLDFIRGRVDALRRQLEANGDDQEARFLLAMYLEKLGDDHLEESLREMDHVLKRSRRKEGGAKSERVRLAKACRALRARGRALSNAQEAGTLLLGNAVEADTACAPSGKKRQKRSPTEEGGREQERTSDGAVTGEDGDEPLRDRARFQPVDERDASRLGYEEFIEKYALPGRPVILKGGASQCFEGGRAWSREFLMKEAGHKTVTVRRWVPGSVSWARLEEAGQARLAGLLTDAPRCMDRGSGAGVNVSDGVNAKVAFREGDTVSGGTIERLGRREMDDHVLLGGVGEARGVRASDFRGGTGTDGGQNGVRNVDESGSHRRTPAAGAAEREPLYLHDWSVPQNLGPGCPLLAGRFKVPKFFAGDMLQRVAGQGLPYTDSWPSLFVGPKGSKSDTHIDSFGSHFWMALLEGKKRWLLYPKDDAPLLYPVWPEGCHDPVFEAELMLEASDTTRHPAALLAKGFQCVLEAGDVLFVPAGCPHRVENLTDTLAVSCNYVDATNVRGALEALEDQALTDPRAGALVSALRGCDPSLVRGQRAVSWEILKTWPREGEIADWVLPPEAPVAQP